MKFTEKINKGSDLFERFNEDLHDCVEDMDRYFHDMEPSEFADMLRNLNEKWQAFASCVRAGFIVVDNGMSETVNDR